MADNKPHLRLVAEDEPCVCNDWRLGKALEELERQIAEGRPGALEGLEMLRSCLEGLAAERDMTLREWIKQTFR